MARAGAGFLAAAFTAAAVLTGAAPVTAAPDPDGAARPLVVEAIGALSPELVGLPIDDEAYRITYDAWQEAGHQLEEAASGRGRAEGRLAELTSARDLLTDELARRHAESLADGRRHEVARARLVELGVASFMGGPTDAVLESAFGPDTLSDGDALRREVFSGAAEDARVSALRQREGELEDARSREAGVAASLAEVEAEHTEVAETLSQLGRQVEEWTAARDARVGDLAPLAPAAKVAGTHLSVVVFDAYWRGAATAWRLDGCRLPWSVLAGIGRVESGHGTSKGAVPDVTGDVVPPIVGIALTGEGGTALVPDTDGGSMDGDPVHDRAVGPMQFIPSTWRSSARDGNGDGVEEVHNLYDTAAAAAGYLCRAAGGSPVGPAGVAAAVFSYNHSQSYVATVVRFADEYAAAVDAPEAT